MITPTFSDNLTLNALTPHSPQEQFTQWAAAASRERKRVPLWAAPPQTCQTSNPCCDFYQRLCNCVLAYNATLCQQMLDGITWECNKENVVPLHPSDGLRNLAYPSPLICFDQDSSHPQEPDGGEVSRVKRPNCTFSLRTCQNTWILLFQLPASPRALAVLLLSDCDCLRVCEWDRESKRASCINRQHVYQK